MTPYEELEARFRELSHLEHAEAILNWDEASMMPRGGGEARGESMVLLAAIAHQRLTHPELGALLVLCSQSLFRFADLGDDGLCRGGPDKGCGVIVSAIDVVVDRLD